MALASFQCLHSLLVRLFSSHSPVTPVVIFPSLCIPVSFACPRVLPVFCIFFPLDLWFVLCFCFTVKLSGFSSLPAFCYLHLILDFRSLEWFSAFVKGSLCKKVDFWDLFLIEALGWWPARPTIPKCIWRVENDSRSTFFQNRSYKVCLMLPCLHLGPVIPDYLPSRLFTQLFKRWLEIRVIS